MFRNQEEIWLPVVGYEGLYEVSNMGRVKSLNYNHTGTERVLRLAKNTGGYLFVELFKDGKAKKHLVHRLVATSFILNPHNLPEVNHINEDKTDNRVENLEWVEHRENINYGTRNERVAKVLTNHPLKSKPVLQLTLEGELVREWPSTQEAGRNGFNQGNVWMCCAGRYKFYKGFIWKYKEADD